MSEALPLLLFDIDGTLLVGDNGGHHAAIVAGLEEVYGLDLAGFSFLTLEPWGKTDLQIARDALRVHGVPEAVASDGLDTWLATAESRHEQIVSVGAHPIPEPAPAARAAASSLSDRALLGLVTGNIEGIARRKLAVAGLGKLFGDRPGGFGSDHHDRGKLVDIARARAGAASPHPAARTVIIGDTPRDIACARAGGVICIAVTTGPFDDAALAEADAVIATLDGLGGALEQLGFGESEGTSASDRPGGESRPR